MYKPVQQPAPAGKLTRRKFMADTGKALGSAVFLSAPLISSAAGIERPAAPVTVGQVIELFVRAVPGGRIADTVDTLKAGSPDTKVTGIVTTMFATIDVIRKAVALQANFIIAHEPTFYNHPDDTKWLEDDEVYRYKAALLKEHDIAVWRNHDYVHSLVPDGVRKGVVEQLGWQQFGDPAQDIFTLTPAPSLQVLIADAKQKLNISMLRYIGNPAQACRRVLLMPGAAGGKNQIGAIRKTKPDVLVCGEVAEWETAEYVRDAIAKAIGWRWWCSGI